MTKVSLFDRVILEAPEDEGPPDIPAEGTGPPDAPIETSADNTVPPDMTEEGGGAPDLEDGGGGGSPPDMGMDDGGNLGDGTEEDQGFGDETPAEGEGQDPNQNLNFDEKISSIMNMNLYQRFLSLLNNIGGQLSMIKNNSDMLYTLSNDSLDIIESLKKLDENIRLYLGNYFLNENYSKNLLFFNKCLNLLKLLNNIFEKNIQKGIKSME